MWLRVDAMSDAATKADAELSSGCNETSDEEYSEDGSISMVSEELEDEIKDIPPQAAWCVLFCQAVFIGH